LKLPVDVDLLAIYPHAHYLGKTIEAWATLPDGMKQPLIRIPNWDINWQAEYEYRTPIYLPKETILSMRITYDNSSENPRNPNHPPKLVVTGNRSQDEMGHVWLQVLPKGPDQRFDLQRAVMQRRLEKYPADFVAHYNLGALEQNQGHLSEAVASYRAALEVEPKNPTARNSLAAVLMMEDRLPDAIEQLQKTLAIDPGYLNARYNLARSLAASGSIDEAAEQYRIFLEARPEDAPAQAALGTILFKKKEIPQALQCFQKAAKEAPEDADVQTNLGNLLAITGDRAGATQAFENALRIDPNHAAAKANLARLRAQ
jgi:tetratricopeptide (TPR) repeat protein